MPLIHSESHQPPIAGRLWTEKELAHYLNVSIPAVRRWRYEKRGPAYAKLGSAVRYQSETVQAWIAQSARAT